MVSLASESDLGEYKDSENPRWLVGILSARGFQNRVPLLQVLSATLLVGDFWGLGRVMLTIGLLLNIPLLIKITRKNFLSGTRNLIELSELNPMRPLSASSSQYWPRSDLGLDFGRVTIRVATDPEQSGTGQSHAPEGLCMAA